MARTVNTYRLGLFALISLGLLVGTALWLKAAFWFEKTKEYVTYFNVSVKGLQKDSPVDYLGVPAGRIQAIQIAPDGRLIEVLLDLKAGFRVDSAVCAQLHVQGLTGLKYLEIDPAPQDLNRLTPRLNFASPYTVIKSYPSEIDVLQLRLDNLYSRLMALDLPALAHSWGKTSRLANNILLQLGASSPRGGDIQATLVSLKHASQDAEALLSTLSRAVTPKQVAGSLADLGASLAATRKITQTLKKQVAALPPGTLRNLSGQIEKTLGAGNAAFSGFGEKINNSAWLLDNDLRELGNLIALLRSFTRNISRQPNSLIFPVKQSTDPFGGK